VEARLEALAQATGRTKTFDAREAILEYLDDLEDLYLAGQRLIDIRAGKTQTVPLEQVIKRYAMGSQRKTTPLSDGVTQRDEGTVSGTDYAAVVAGNRDNTGTRLHRSRFGTAGGRAVDATVRPG
jgi:RHH-type rel operon transcriptional repressor/antitoxin RelB